MVVQSSEISEWQWKIKIIFLSSVGAVYIQGMLVIIYISEALSLPDICLKM